MTTDINKLLERLRTYYGDDLACRMLLMDARHALEAMAGEVASLQNTFDLMWKADQRAIKLWQEATGKDHIWPDKTKTTLWLLERAEAAEAERDRLKAALVPFAKLETWRGAHDPGEGTMRMRVVTVPEIEVARKALEDAAGDGR